MPLFVRNVGNEYRLLNNRDGVNDMRVGGPASATASNPRFMVQRVAKVPLAALDTGGGVLSWQNDESATIVISRVEIYITTIATAACTIDVGTTATNATTSSDNLLDGLDTHSATGLFDNITDKGTNGKSRQTLASGKWVTASMASGAAAGTVGYAYIHYHLV